jgi:hypothetical protein
VRLRDRRVNRCRTRRRRNLKYVLVWLRGKNDFRNRLPTMGHRGSTPNGHRRHASVRAISGQPPHIPASAADRPAKNFYSNHYFGKATMVPFGDLVDVRAVVPSKPSNEVVEQDIGAQQRARGGHT